MTDALSFAPPRPDAVPPDGLEPIPPLDILGLLRTLWFGKWIVLLVTALSIMAAGYYAFSMATPRYTATATLKVDVQPLALHDVGDRWPDPGTDAASLNTEVAILTSADILGRVAGELDLLQDPEFNRYLAPQSPYSVRSLRTRLRHFLSGTVEQVPDDLAIFDKTIQNLRGAVTATRPRDTYIFQISATSQDAQKAALIANTAAEVYVASQVAAKDEAARIAIGWLSTRVEELQAQLQSQETAVTDLIATAQLQEDGKLDGLSNLVLALDQDIAAAEADLNALKLEGPGTARHAAEVAQVTERISTLAAQRNRLRGQLSAQSAGLVSLHQMRREADATRAIYETYLARLQETRIQRGLAEPNSQIIAAATQGQYAGPRKVLILTLGAIVGAMSGIGLLIARHVLQRGIMDAQSLRRLTGLPVIAQLPKAVSRPDRRLLRRIVEGKAMALNDAVLAMRAMFHDAGRGDVPRTILFTSAIQGEDKTTLAVALAKKLEEAGKRVLLLAADAKPLIHALGPVDSDCADGLQPDKTLADVVTRNRDLGVDILPLDKAETALDTQFSELFAEMRVQYDHIVIDAPPVLVSATANVLGHHADATLFAVRWAKTPVHLVKTGLQILAEHEIAPSGLILTRVDLRRARQGAAGTWPATRQSVMPV